jgi:5-methylcytosine-specific restriction enzyme subunit McrC
MNSSAPVITLSEWESERRAPVDELTESDRRLAVALKGADGGRLLVDERRDGVWITSRSWVGVVRFADFEVRVVPKLAGGNIGLVRMLDYASGLGALRRHEASRQLETVGDDLIDLIAWLFADACTPLVRDGLLNDYVAHEDALHVLRGRLRIIDQARFRFGQVDPLEVTFDEFESDIPENQLIAAALQATRSVVRSPMVQRPIRRLHAVFSEAANPLARDPLVLAAEMTYTRRNEHYRVAHHLAVLLLRRLAIRDLFTPGGTTSFAFLLDMNQLFEDFVTRLVGQAMRQSGVRVHAQRRDRSIIVNEATNRPYSAIIPDLLLEAGRGGTMVRLPVDAKYKLYDERRLQEADVYQMFLYAFAYAPHHTRQPARAVILYPRAGEGVDVALRVMTDVGNRAARIQAFGVDIRAALAAIDRGRVVTTDVPALGRLHQVFSEVVASVEQEASWLASSA